MSIKYGKNLNFHLTTLIIGLLALQACKPYYFRSNYQDSKKLLYETKNLQTRPYLKAHLKNGEVYILKDTWQIDTIRNLVIGNGDRYGLNRNLILAGDFSLNIDSVAIFETNKKLEKTESDRIAAITVLTALDVAMQILCITNPKACFGSCPTFYVEENHNSNFADAEGFSNAILPSMEYFDIDALNNQPITGNTFSITMKNEALETHCINDIKLLAYPRKKSERIYQSSGNDFYLCQNSYQLTQAYGPEGDITSLLGNADRQVRYSLADDHNLSSKEEIYLTFSNINNIYNLGLIVNFRQTLMTTYFIYSAMGYMGDDVGDIFAKTEIENQSDVKLKNSIKKELGNIDVYLWNENDNIWELQAGFYETGPIAFNHQILPLSGTASGSDIRIKIVLNKGLWHIDYIGLTNIMGKVEPIEIGPDEIFNKGKSDAAALSQISKSDRYLISLPGSEYIFKFQLPKSSQDYELFLYSKGYYLEWMRENWIKDKDLRKLRLMIENPKKYLKAEAKAYKFYEQTMEQEFWNSKINTKTFSYNEI